MTAIETDKIGRAKAHLATCMEREDWPSHNCACDCGDVSELLAEVDRLTFLHQQDHALADRYQEHREAAERELANLYEKSLAWWTADSDASERGETGDPWTAVEWINAIESAAKVLGRHP